MNYDDPFYFDKSKLLVFKLPKAESAEIYDHIDGNKPIFDIRDSKYFK